MNFCKSALAVLPVLFVGMSTYAVELTADGRSNSYDLINEAMAPGATAIEVPDCGHEEFGPHITQVFDAVLKRPVFRFHIHRDQDDDRCRKDDRQRTEIKIYAKSPDRLKAFSGDRFTYRWKFRLDAGFQPSRNFTHLHQIKAVGGSYDSMPLFTLTARKGRKGSPDWLEARYAPQHKSKVMVRAPLHPFLGKWLSVTEEISYRDEGQFSIRIVDALSGKPLLVFRNSALSAWKEGADFIRPKWGIYRSLKDRQNLRDEIVDFADFRIEPGP